MEFQVGDIVEGFGNRGTVNSINTLSSHPVFVHYDDPRLASETFTLDGRAYVYHKTASLKLISRPRKTKKVTIWVNVTKYKYGTMNIIQHESEEMARLVAGTNAVTQQIEVEVLE